MMSTGSKAQKLLIIDTDPGVDDAQAILMALSSPDVDVIALTVTHGNVTVEQTTRNTLRILNVAGRMDIPVFKGCATPLEGDRISSTFVHGANGLGDVPDVDAPGLDKAQNEHAVTALVRIVNTNPGVISLVCLGPLTNIAMALRLDPDFGDKLKDCYVMGGNYHATGNTPLNACAEFNFLADPDAASIVLNNIRCDVTMVCWELCLSYAFSWEWYDKFSNMPTKKSKFVKSIGAKSLDIYFKRGTVHAVSKYETADSMLMAVAIDDSLACDSRHVYCTVELRGQYTRGQMVVDWDGCLGPDPNVTIVKTVNHDAYGNMMLKAVM